MSVALHRWEALITIPTGDWDCALVETGGSGASGTVKLTAAKDYYHSSDGNDSATFAEALATDLDRVGAGTYAVSVSQDVGGTGRYSIACSVGATGITSFAITWTDPAFGAVMGFTSTITGALTYTSPAAAQGLWLPDGYYLGLTGVDDPLDKSDQTVAIAPGGTSAHRLQYSRMSIIEGARYQSITRARVRIAGETYANESWQKFWRDVIDGDLSAYLSLGYVRIYPDVSTDATYYDFWVDTSPDCTPTALKEGWQGLFDVPCPRLILDT